MTDTTELKRRIDESGLKYQFLADKIGITRAALYQKINNISVFRIDEVAKLCDLLGIRTLTERDKIFFAKEVE